MRMTVIPHSFDLLRHDKTIDLTPDDAELKDAAKAFEAAFIGQMLTFSGLGKSLVSGEGEMASAFTGFFIEALAEDLADTGAFGLAEQFYEKLNTKGSLND